MEDVVEEEVNQHEEAGDNQYDEELPLPPTNDLVQVMANQNCLLEVLARGINRPRNHEYGCKKRCQIF